MAQFQTKCVLLVAAAAMVSASCGRLNKGNSAAPAPAPVATVAEVNQILLGQGLNDISNTALGNCVTLGPLQTQSGNTTGETAEFELLELTSESDLRTSLAISASGSFGGLTGSVGGSLSFADNVQKNSKSRYLMVHTRVANQLEIASSFTYTQDVQNLLTGQGGTGVGTDGTTSKDFVDKCGTQFVYGRRTGGEFYAVLEFNISSDDEQKEFSAAIGASGLGWKASASINSALQAYNMFALTKIYMYRVGTAAAFPENDSIEDFAKQFPSMVQLASAPVALTMLTKSYDGVAPLNLHVNPGIYTNQEYVMTQLATMRDTATEQLNTALYILANQGLYDAFSVADLQQSGIETYLNAVNGQAVQCMANIWSGCILPTVTLPRVTFPALKSGVYGTLAPAALGAVSYLVPAAFSQYASTQTIDGIVTRDYALPASAVHDPGTNGMELQIQRAACTSASAYIDGVVSGIPAQGRPVRDLLQGGPLGAHSVAWNLGQSLLIVALDPSPADQLCTILAVNVDDAALPWSQLPQTLDIIRRIVLSANYGG